MNTKLLGRWGEAQAAEYLRKKGYILIGLGYTTRFGEIDIIVENRQYIVFVEVKLRKNKRFAEAKEFVDAGKQKRISASANLWLSCNETDKQPRFDVVEVYAPDGENTKNPVINHIENAF